MEVMQNNMVVAILGKCFQALKLLLKSSSSRDEALWDKNV